MKRRNFIKFAISAGSSLLLPNITNTKPKTFGEKILNDSSAIKRINHKRAILEIQRIVGNWFNDHPLEFNDEIYREQTRRHLNQLFAMRFFNVFTVICDDTNNPPSIIKNGEMIVDIYINFEKDEYTVLNCKVS